MWVAHSPAISLRDTFNFLTFRCNVIKELSLGALESKLSSKNDKSVSYVRSRNILTNSSLCLEETRVVIVQFHCTFKVTFLQLRNINQKMHPF